MQALVIRLAPAALVATLAAMFVAELFGRVSHAFAGIAG